MLKRTDPLEGTQADSLKKIFVTKYLTFICWSTLELQCLMCVILIFLLFHRIFGRLPTHCNVFENRTYAFLCKWKVSTGGQLLEIHQRGTSSAFSLHYCSSLISFSLEVDHTLGHVAPVSCLTFLDFNIIDKYLFVFILLFLCIL